MLKLKISKENVLLVIIEAATRKLESINRQLQYQLYRYSVTGLYNRKFLMEKGNEFLEEGYNVLAVIDIRNLRTYNEIFGYDTTDKILRKIADRIRELCEDSCIIGNLDSGRFWLLSKIRGKNKVEETEKRAQMLIDNLTKDELTISIDHEEIVILLALNIGIAFYPEHGRDISELLKAAEMATDRAKASKVNTYRIFEESFRKEVEENIWIEENIRKAIRTGEIEEQIYPVFQIKVNPSTEEVTGVEVLMRWKLHPNIGKVVGIAEKTGLINTLFEIMLKKAIPTMLKAWDIKPDIHFGFNVSPNQLALYEDFKSILEIFVNYGVDISKIELEITETELLANTEIEQLLQRCIKKGFKLIVDDFGKGYSSFERLKNWDIYGVKIDKALIADLPNYANKQPSTSKGLLLLKNLTQFLKNMGYKITFEGVEDKTVVEMAREWNVDEIQGFYYAQPVEADRFLDCLQNWESVKRCFP